MAGSTATQIYNGDTNSSGLSVTSQFSGASFCYAISPSATDDYEIDCHLQLELGSIVKRIPLETIYLRTNNVLLIPQEYRNCGLPLRLALVTDEVVNLKIFSVQCNCCGKEELEEILTKLRWSEFRENLTLTNQLLQDTALAAMATSMGASLAVITGGTSLAIPGSVLPVLSPALTALPLAGVLVGFP